MWSGKTYEELTVPQPLAIWSSARDAWETPGTEGLFCEHLDVFSETFPTSGTMRNGEVYALPTWEPRIPGSGYSSSPNDEMTLLLTPVASEGTKPSNVMGVARRKATGEVFLTNQIVTLMGLDPTETHATLLPTPTVSDTNGPGKHGDGGLDLRTAVSLLPTPRASDGFKGGPNQRGSSGDMMLPSAVFQLLPTPTVGNAAGTNERRGGVRGDELLLPGAAKAMRTGWGRYEAAIRRWERIFGRPAPAPTEPNAKGNHRLSPKLTEWMMGAPEGWITDIPISRNEQLKACGNGVVRQQAVAALNDMLAAFQTLRAAA
jgi:DNA (cytosine-5)-methyltransferase 1